jgi:pimeloyl-ACP methyl ester carboxylesterase
MTHEVELSAGTIEYEEVGGPGPVVVLLPGLLMDGLLWADVVEELAPHARCIAPTLPLGAHRYPMHEDADLSPRGLARLVSQFLTQLDLKEVTLIGNDTGGALVQLVLCADTSRIGRVVLVSCDAFDNFPPGATGRVLVMTGRLPPTLFGLFMQQMRLKPLRRLPLSFGWLTKRGDEATKRWMSAVLKERSVRRDTVRVLRAIGRERGVLLEAADCLPRFERPALVVWAKEDRVMPPEHGRRLADMLPQARLVEIADSYTLIPLDQPRRLARAIREFLAAES